MNNADKPAYPLEAHGLDTGRTVEYHEKQDGLTKREKYCLENKVPRTGDPELDDIIRQSLKQDAAMAAMQGLLSNPETMKEMTSKEQEISVKAEKIAAVWATEQADALLKQLEETQ